MCLVCPSSSRLHEGSFRLWTENAQCFSCMLLCVGCVFNLGSMFVFNVFNVAYRCMYLVPGTQAVVLLLLVRCKASCLESKSIVTCDVMM